MSERPICGWYGYMCGDMYCNGRKCSRQPGDCDHQIFPDQNDATDEARAYLKETFGPEFTRYIDTRLAGDFACKVADKLKEHEGEQ